MEKLFNLSANKSSVKNEVIGGVTTFLAMMYIIVVNPAILSETGMSFSAVLTATVLVSAFSSIAMGLYAKSPIAIAPGMGLNAFFTFGVVLGMKVPWQTALGAVFWSGIIFILLSIFNIRTHIVKAIPRQLRFAVAAGIGLFITFIGFVNGGFIVANPATLVSFKGINAVTVTFAIGLFVTSVLVVKRIKGALILGIVFTTLLAIPIGRYYGDASWISPIQSSMLVEYNGFFSAPDFSLLFQLDFMGSLKLAMWPVIFAFLFTDMFDSISTFIGVAEAADLLDEKGEPLHVKECLIVDAASTTISGLFGTSAGTSYIESATGVEEGGRTGMTAVVTGLLFLPFMFLSPLLSVVPGVATATALVLVGVFMMKPVSLINWTKFDDAIPAFIAMILIPLTYSITQGIVWGFLSWTAIKLLTGKREEVSPTLIIIDVLAVMSLVL
ncbi:MAG: NCS2 family permease [Spirochaetes bacterium]|jgi:AGZA family xanthine/uracil permease-like MFS transporter|nr:NCS2 family permease [Spirochaetota bacterium]